MIRPSIKTYHEDRHDPIIAPLGDRSYFMGKNIRELNWLKKNPSVNIKRNGSIFEMQVALPGFEKEDIQVLVEDNILTVLAEKKTEELEVPSEFILNEFEVDRLERKFKLAKGIGHEKIEAEYVNGILKLSFIDVPLEEEKEIQNIDVF